MPPSQLKRLKASLREQGITGPQKPKKKSKQNKDAVTKTRIERNAALATIREHLNPFEVKQQTRPSKHDVTTVKNRGLKEMQGVLGRPGVTRSAGEEARRRTLLVEMQRRNKVGGIVDRRIGEYNPSLTPEERAVRRLAREKMGKRKKTIFDLERDDDEEEVLTHGGRALDLDSVAQDRDDFDAGSLTGSDDGSPAGNRKRRRAEEDGDLDEPRLPAAKKSRTETIKDIVSRDRLRKYENQMAKEADEEIREELDKGLGDLQAALASFSRKAANGLSAEAAANGAADTNSSMNADRASLIGLSDKDYDRRLREIAADRRSKPSDRTKTGEERAKEEAERLKELEEERFRRMRGEEEGSDPGDTAEGQDATADGHLEIQEGPDDAADFGFKAPRVLERPPGFEDEDEFIIDDGLVASESEADQEVASAFGDHSSDSDESDLPDEILALQRGGEEETLGDALIDQNGNSANHLAEIYECPRSLEEMHNIVRSIPFEQIPEVIRRIRLSNDLSRAAANREKLADFAQVLVAYIGELAIAEPPAPLVVVEQVIRHVHSMARTFPDQISKAFRDRLGQMHQEQRMNAGDLTTLTAIGTIYPTSDHFHQVVTPAITIIARWLGLTSPQTAKDFHTGAYLVTLSLKFQSLSKRYIPEAVRFTLLALKSKWAPAILEPHINNLSTMATLWADKSAFIEIFTPAAVRALHALRRTKELQRLTLQIEAARLRRRPLALHNHRAQPIKSAIPKFEESFNPDKHYDPDRERADAARLRKEYKRERKGALRELRKDANFLAREKLREKRERDRAYEDKYRRLVAGIQGEEGAEKNRYEREKRLRKGKGRR